MSNNGGLQRGAWGRRQVAVGSGGRAAVAVAAAAHLDRRGGPPRAAERLAIHLVPAVRRLEVSDVRKSSEGHNGIPPSRALAAVPPPTKLMGSRGVHDGMVRHRSTVALRFWTLSCLPCGLWRSRWRHRAASTACPHFLPGATGRACKQGDSRDKFSLPEASAAGF